ncbi:MAG: hypothetical protein VX768_12945 [Planctomycetota bacterium]|nr:hypothetical protein [Planctomycetota bacterium]
MLCPWLMLTQAVSIATRPTIVLVCLVALVLTPLGWQFGSLFLADGEVSGTPFPLDQQDYSIRVRTQVATATHWQDDFVPGRFFQGQGPLYVYGKFYEGHFQLLNRNLNLRQWFYFAIGTVWMLLLWAIPGGIVCRIAALHFTRDERIGFGEAFGFVRRRMVTFWTSSLVPLGILLMFVLPFFVFGLMIRADFMLAIAGLGWLLVILLALFMAVILIPLFLGWPLLWPAIASESADPFDAVSRCYSYPTQKPFRYFFYWLVILLLGYFATWVAFTISDKTVDFSRWGVSWGSGGARIEEISQGVDQPAGRNPLQAEGAEPSDASLVGEDEITLHKIGVSAIGFWEGSVRLLATAFSYGFFFVAMTGMYLLLRKDNDFVELDQVHVEVVEETLPLPDLQSTEPRLPQQLVPSPPGEPSSAESPAENPPAEPAADPSAPAMDSSKEGPAGDAMEGQDSSGKGEETNQADATGNQGSQSEAAAAEGLPESEKDDEQPRLED